MATFRTIRNIPPRISFDFSSNVDRLTREKISGGGAYDALIGLTAASHRMELLTRDSRAAATYARLGVPFGLLQPSG